MLINKLKMLEIKHKPKERSKNPLYVYYGWAKVNKIRKKEAISVIYENQSGAGGHHRYGKTLSKFQHTVYTRVQTEKEAEDAQNSNRIFTEYLIFLDDKKVQGSLTLALQANSDADRNNVSKNERDKIAKALQEWYKIHHPDHKERAIQMELDFNN